MLRVGLHLLPAHRQCYRMRKWQNMQRIVFCLFCYYCYFLFLQKEKYISSCVASFPSLFLILLHMFLHQRGCGLFRMTLSSAAHLPFISLVSSSQHLADLCNCASFPRYFSLSHSPTQFFFFSPDLFACLRCCANILDVDWSRFVQLPTGI